MSAVSTPEPDTATAARPDLKPLRDLAPYLRPYLGRVAGALLALMVAAATVLSLGVALRRLVDEGVSGGDPTLLDHAVVLLLIAIVVLAAATYARFYLVSWLGERVVADIRRAVFDRLVTFSPAFYEVHPVGALLSRLNSDTTVLQMVVGSSASMALRNLLLLLGGTVMLAVTSPRLTGLVFVMVPLVVAPILIFGRRVRRLSRTSQDRLADVGAHIDETLNAVRTVQAYGNEALVGGRFASRVEAAFGAALARIRARAILTAVVILLAFGAVAIILWLGGRDVVSGRISPGQLSAFVFYAVVVAGAVGAVSEVWGDLQRAAGATEHLVQLLTTEPEIAAPAQPAALPQPPRGAVAFEDVCFRYPARPHQAALDRFALSVAPGETVALVGPSGAGKSTVFQLLLRFYDPASGNIAVDGVDLRTADPAALRQRVGLVAQDPVLFAASAAENIRFGRPDAADAEVRAAAEAAHATEFLDRLPQGLATELGERGVRLSAGQRQRIAIARALLRDPPILLLDEATSALDAESEHAVQQALERIMAGRTTLVIAHRLATVLKADRIVVMDQGRVIASGRHEDLVRQGGLYARLAELQFVEGEEGRKAKAAG